MAITKSNAALMYEKAIKQRDSLSARIDELNKKLKRVNNTIIECELIMDSDKLKAVNEYFASAGITIDEFLATQNSEGTANILTEILKRKGSDGQEPAGVADGAAYEG